ncbi:C2H2 type zinc finger domain-containing protein [Rutstroemia sp. NJR-2017a WRK4]|nr:C2H2 type zinc finger domain-containing protein [Rutstroemia sp. NJR-2017a WRK4]
MTQQISDAIYDPDDVGLRGSPIFSAMTVNLEPSPSPEAYHLPPTSPEPSPGGRNPSKRSSNQACQADAVLVALMAGGRRPDIARNAGDQALPSDEEDEESPARGTEVAINEENINSTKEDLHHLTSMAVTALKVHKDSASQVSNAPVIFKSPPTGDTSEPVNTTIASPSSHLHLVGPRHESRTGILIKTEALPPGELPPIRHSPHADSANRNGVKQITLPSITDLTDQLGDINKLADGQNRNETSFSQSPPAGPPIPRFNAIPRKTPPAKSPIDLRRELPSPGMPGPRYFAAPRPPSQQEGPQLVAASDYSSGSNTETPSTDQSGSTPTTAIDRMSIDGITNPQVGGYQCTNPGCTAPPFQTQYLLNSHANVHSSNRPHYCPVKGCPRGEGGKGFKRKNEMIRHGLVHESPGYVCPFCPDREHKYPRPDNLQRHVRVHHTDKDKDDPQLREVLSQRPEGGNRGRRRRGGS